MDNPKKQTKRNKKPWPTKDIMEQIYNLSLWGGEEFDFYSGDGSHDPELVNPYIEAILLFLNSFDENITVCDLGCGDFNVGKQLVHNAHSYVAVDIVEDLIERNKQIFQSKHLEFRCLDIVNEPLPDGDVALVRQVLQHLSNAEIHKIALKLKKYKYVILTEHIPKGVFTPNKDIISGQGNRLKKKSGVNLLASPFELKVKKEKLLLSLKDSLAGSIIVTWLYEMH
jgi:SAM-dependent methyltransferase